MSFSFFSARTLTPFFAGFAATSIISPGLNGFGTFFLAGWAGLCWTTILQRPGSVKAPAPFLLRALEISSTNASKTRPTSFLATPVVSEMLAYTSVLVGGFLAGAFAMGLNPPNWLGNGGWMGAGRAGRL